jgi:hypothetical protein
VLRLNLLRPLLLELILRLLNQWRFFRRRQELLHRQLLSLQLPFALQLSLLLPLLLKLILRLLNQWRFLKRSQELRLEQLPSQRPLTLMQQVWQHPQQLYQQLPFVRRSRLHLLQQLFFQLQLWPQTELRAKVTVLS